MPSITLARSRTVAPGPSNNAKVASIFAHGTSHGESYKGTLQRIAFDLTRRCSGDFYENIEDYSFKSDVLVSGPSGKADSSIVVSCC